LGLDVAGQPTLTVGTNLLAPLRRVKGKWRGRCVLSALLSLGLLGALAAVSGCAGPTLRPATSVGTGAIVQEAPGLRISVEAEAWHGRPRSLPERVLPFLVQLKNAGSAPLTIQRTDFLLLDDANRQYGPLAPSEVVTLLGGRASGVGVSPSVGISGSTAGSTVFGVGLGISLGGSGDDTRDVISQALPEGSLLAGAEIKGFVYFPRPAAGYKSLRLVVAPREIPGQPRLDFEFRRTDS